MKRFRFRYTVKSSGLQLVKDYDAVNPVSAINGFHSFVQLDQGFSHNDYRIDGMVHTYANDGLVRTGDMIESPVDYPKSPNPDLTKPLNLTIASGDPFVHDPEFDFTD